MTIINLINYNSLLHKRLLLINLCQIRLINKALLQPRLIHHLFLNLLYYRLILRCEPNTSRLRQPSLHSFLVVVTNLHIIFEDFDLLWGWC